MPNLPNHSSVSDVPRISRIFSFLVDSYKVRLEFTRQSGNVTDCKRIVEIVSVPVAKGIVVRALLAFSTFWDNWTGNRVGTYRETDPAHPVLEGWLPSTEYSFWYDVLRSESPLTFEYEITQIPPGSFPLPPGLNHVKRIELGTSTEPVGEGPTDVSK